MLIRILKSLAFIVLIVASVYGLLLYLTRIDFKPVPLAGPPSSQLRVGAWIMDIPQSLEVKRYQVRLHSGPDFLYLSEGIEEPPAIMSDDPPDLIVEHGGVLCKAPEMAVTSDISAEMGRPASMEAVLVSFCHNRDMPPHRWVLTTRVLIPQSSGFLAIANWMSVNHALGNRDKLEEIISDHKPLLINQVKTILPYYRWLGPDIVKKPEGFMTQYGLLDPTSSSIQPNTVVQMSPTGENLNPVKFSFFIWFGQVLNPDGQPDYRPSSREKIDNSTMRPFGYSKQIHTKHRQVGGISGYETVIFYRHQQRGDWDSMSMRWVQEPQSGGPGTFYLSYNMGATNFDSAGESEMFSLWRHVLDRAR